MAEITKGIRLTLKDAFSQGIKDASKAGSTFGANMKQVASGVDRAFSGIAGTMASIGVGLGVAATVNKTIEFEDRLTRIGTVAGATSDEMKAMKKQIFDAAMMPDIKMSPDEIVSAVDIIMTKTGNLDFAKANIENIGRAMQGMNASGEEIGGMMAEFDKLGYSAQEVTTLLDEMYLQGNKGAFTSQEFAKNGSAIIAAYSAIGTSAEDIKKANAAMQILTMGTKDPTSAVTVLENAMQELGSPEKQKKLKALGINVRDSEGKFRDFNDIMLDIVDRGKEMGNFDQFGSIFGGTSLKAIQAFSTYGDKVGDFLELGDTAGALNEAVAKNASTLKSNLTNLQTAFMAVANSGLEKPLENITKLLNKMAESPGAIKATFSALIGGMVALAAVRGLGSIINLINGMKQMRSGKQELALGMGGASSAMPVFVTNMGQGGFGGGNGEGGNIPSKPLPKSIPSSADIKKYNANLLKQNALSAGLLATIMTAGYKTVGAFSEIQEINTSDMSEVEKKKAKGGVAGDAVGSVIGTGIGVAGGALVAAKVGAIIGTAIAPGVGTAIGGAIGAGVGALGGWLGGMAGKKIGETLATPETEAIQKRRKALQYTGINRSQYESFATKNQLPSGAKAPIALGEGTLTIDVNVSNDKVRVVTGSLYGNMPIRNTGNVKEVRSLN